MNDSICIGILGKLFGHSFKRYLITESCELPYTSFEVNGKDAIENLFDSHCNKYMIMCKRCGLQKS